MINIAILLWKKVNFLTVHDSGGGGRGYIWGGKGGVDNMCFPTLMTINILHTKQG